MVAIRRTNADRKPGPSLPSTVIPLHVQLARDYLSARGVTLEVFEAAGGQIATNANRIYSGYPAGPALLFQFFDPLSGASMTYKDGDGNLIAFQRIRPLSARPASSAKFLQERDSGTHVYFAKHANIDWPTIARDPAVPVVLSEGETRSLSGAALSIPVIAVTGVDCGQQEGKLHPDLECFTWTGRQAFFAFDNDVARKADAQKALRKLTSLLQARGAQVFNVLIPAAPDGCKQGLDDYLARYGARAFNALVNSPETRPAEGAEAFDPPLALSTIMATDYPPTEWLWRDFILKGEVNLLYGDGGTGKSLLSLHIALAAAAGIPLFGSPTMQTTVIGFYAEDGPSQVKQRVQTAARELGIRAPQDLPVLLWCAPRGETLLANISDKGEVTELPRLHALRTELEAVGGPSLLIVDSLADLFALNESLRLPVNAALKRVLGGLCRDYGVTVLVLAHPSKASMQDGSYYSGSTAFNNGVRQRLTLEIVPQSEIAYAADGPAPRRLSVSKTNYGTAAEKILYVYGPSISLLPPAVPEGKSAEALRLRVAIPAAIEAAKNNVPLNRRDKIPDIVFRDAEKALGYRPHKQQIRDALDEAVRLQELQYISHTRHRAAGYYPPDSEGAVEMAISAKRAARSEEQGGEGA